jgi:hypothetical protein
MTSWCTNSAQLKLIRRALTPQCLILSLNCEIWTLPSDDGDLKSFVRRKFWRTIIYFVKSSWPIVHNERRNIESMRLCYRHLVQDRVSFISMLVDECVRKDACLFVAFNGFDPAWMKQKIRHQTRRRMRIRYQTRYYKYADSTHDDVMPCS